MQHGEVVARRIQAENLTSGSGAGILAGGRSIELSVGRLRKRASGDGLTLKNENRQSSDLSVGELQVITLEALYTRVARDITELSLDRVTVQDKLYVHGRDIRDDKRFLSDPLGRPRYRQEELTVRNAMFGPQEKQVRHDRCVRVVDWSGELVLSIFLRFSKLGHNLFVESSYFLLTPVAERFRAVDAMSPYFNLGRFIKSIVATAITTPFVTLWAPFELLGRIFGKFHRWSAHREEDALIRENPTFDYGAAFSFRQWASANEYRRYFQRLDKEMYFKILEKNILDSILTFLEEHDVDVSELKQRQNMILNQGVIVSGGNMTTQSMSVGLGAKVENITQKRFTAKAAAPQPAGRSSPTRSRHMTYTRNEGVVVSGGNFTATNVATGRNAQINQSQAGDSGAAQEAQKQLALLIEALQKHGNQISNIGGSE